MLPLAHRLLRLAWRSLCALVGAAIIGILVWAVTSALWLGVAAAVLGAALGWIFGRFVSPVDLFAGPIGGW